MHTRPVVAILFFVCVFVSFTNAQQSDQPGATKSINDLLIQRRDVLSHRVRVLQQQYTQGTTNIDDVILARDQLLLAELELVTDRDERIRLYRVRLDNMRQLEVLAEQRFGIGEGALDARLSTTAARLQAEIEWLREQS